MAVKIRCTVKKAGRQGMYSINTPKGNILGQFMLENTQASDTGLDSELVCSIYKACNTYMETLYMKGIKV